MELRVHLKVCEGCGCLWYRAQVDTRVYCTSCQERFKEFPTPQSRKRRGRPKKTILPAVYAVHEPAGALHTACLSRWSSGSGPVGTRRRFTAQITAAGVSAPEQGTADILPSAPSSTLFAAGSR